MKKSIFSVLSLILVALMLGTCVSAASFSSDEPTDLGKMIFNHSASQDNITSYKGEIGTNLFNLAPGGGSFCVKFDTYVMYEFTAPADGTYTFCLTYIARTGKDRGIDYSIDDPNGTKRVYIDLEESDETHYVTDTFETTAGVHQFYVYAPTGMDDDTLKSCDVYNVALYFTKEAEKIVIEEEIAEEPAEAEAAPAEEAAPAAAPAAPQTSDTAFAAAAVAIISLSAAFVVASKKRV